MQIHVSSREAVEGILSHLTGKVAIISVTDPDEPTVCDDHANILRLQFHDLDKIWPQLTTVTYFDESAAEQIVDFVENNKTVDHLIVHCEAGISRSPAIAAAICEHLNIYHSFFKTHTPNTMVFTILRVKFGFCGKPGSQKIKVYVCYLELGYDGNGIPERVFRSKESAEEWIEKQYKKMEYCGSTTGAYYEKLEAED